jgi:crotonobetainyl-CoA:carnitine CoA-transferase CaiB-like acyl-CoA transferase
MGQLGFPRTLRLLDWLMQAGLPDSDAILAALLEADPSGVGQYLQAALAGAARPTLLERIYAPDRLAALMAACEAADGKQVAA